jgi:4-amino-4-deoxy-L-arabinose transferase-like glycosyltransferase
VSAAPRWFAPGWGLVAIVGVATALRVAHVLALRGSLWFDHLVIDPEHYDAWARRIAAGDWMGERVFYMDPLYPYVLGLLYRACGRDLLLARLLNVGFSAASCALIGVLGRRLGGARTGLLAALGFALYEPEIFYVGEVDKTSLSIALTAASLLLVLTPTLPARFGAGVALGLASLTRANLLLLAPLVALAFLRGWDGGSEPKRRLTGALLFGAGFGLVLLPVAWRNHHVSGAWVLTTSQAGQNFYTGNNPSNPYGAYGALPFVRGTPAFEEVDFRAAAEARAGRPLEPPEVSRFWFAEAFRHMREQPAFAARAMARKAALFWNDFEISDYQDQYLLEQDSPILRLPLLGFGWIVPFALLGVLAFRERRAARLLVGFVVVYSVTVIAFFIFSRYRIQVVPALLPLAALGAVELAGCLRASAWARLGTAAAILVGAGLFCFQTIGIFSRHNEHAIDLRLRHRAKVEFGAGRADEAIASFQEAVRRCPLRCPGALGELVDIYLQTGRRREGEEFLRRFMRAHPTHPDAAGHLARLLAAPENAGPFDSNLRRGRGRH